MGPGGKSHPMRADDGDGPAMRVAVAAEPRVPPSPSTLRPDQTQARTTLASRLAPAVKSLLVAVLMRPVGGWLQNLSSHDDMP